MSKKKRIKEAIKELVRRAIIKEYGNGPIERDDFVISDDRGNRYSLGSEDYGHIGTFDDFDDALAAFNRWTKKNGYYPNLWYVNNHGNAQQIDNKGNYIGRGYV
jgi:hypothetical protein